MTHGGQFVEYLLELTRRAQGISPSHAALRQEEDATSIGLQQFSDYQSEPELLDCVAAAYFRSPDSLLPLGS